MNSKKLLSAAVLTAIAISGLAATANGTNSGKSDSYILKAYASEKSYTSSWYFGGTPLSTTTSLTTDVGEAFDLLDTNTQTSKDFVLKTATSGNLKKDLPIEVKIEATSFHAVDSTGTTLTDANAFDTASSVTEAGYSFEANPIIPEIAFTTYTDTTGSNGVTYVDAVDNSQTTTILKGYHAPELLVSSFTLSFAGNENVLAGSYESDLTFSITYGD